MQDSLPNFSKDWFSMHVPVWQEVLQPLAGKADLKFLEIGVMEGRATHWLLSNILTHPTAGIVCIDTFEGSKENISGPTFAQIDVDNLLEIFQGNISMFAEKVEVMQGLSQELLRTLPIGRFDFVYIDGSHRSADALEDAVLSFRLLKSDAIMIFDDYEWGLFEGTLDNPRLGIDAFLKVFEDQYSLVCKGYQVVLRKH